MAAIRDSWRLPDGDWTMVRCLDRADLAMLAPSISQWLAEEQPDFHGTEDVATFDEDDIFR